MKHKWNSNDVDRNLSFFKTPPQEEMDRSEARIMHQLRNQQSPLREVRKVEPARATPVFRRLLVMAAAAVIAFVVLMQTPARRYFGIGEVDAHAIAVEGSLSRVSREGPIVQLGERVEPGVVLRSNNDRGVIAVADGSRVELQAQSEVSIEPDADSVRINLNSGSVVLKTPRFVFVRTRDVYASVNGTFLVSSRPEGSRIAVFEGAVRVLQGAMKRDLAPGEQGSTAPSIQWPVLGDALAWNHNAGTLMAMLQQLPPNPVREPQQRFEEASIRPSAPLPLQPAGGRGGPSGTTACGGAFQSGSPVQLDPRHLTMKNATVFRLITLAYGRNCRIANEAKLLTGPDWIKTAQFDVNALIPEGSPAYSVNQLNRGEAPELQAMLQSMLSERFNLSIHRETKEVATFNLVMVKPGKVRLSEDQTAPAPIDLSGLIKVNPPARSEQSKAYTPSSRQPPRGLWTFHIDPPNGKIEIAATAVPLLTVIDMVQGEQGRVIVDKTGLNGLIDITYEVLDVGPFEMNGPSVWPEVFRQLGLRLEPASGPLELLAIDRVERPTEN
jgi:uncharacterized protein (TIGR03435 family)